MYINERLVFLRGDVKEFRINLLGYLKIFVYKRIRIYLLVVIECVFLLLYLFI